MDASLHLSTSKPLGSVPDRPNVPVGLSSFHGPSSQSAALPGKASADLILSSQALTWQAEPAATGPGQAPGDGFRCMVHGLQTRPMGAPPVSSHTADQVHPWPTSPKPLPLLSFMLLIQFSLLVQTFGDLRLTNSSAFALTNKAAFQCTRADTSPGHVSWGASAILNRWTMVCVQGRQTAASQSCNPDDEHEAFEDEHSQL